MQRAFVAARLQQVTRALRELEAALTRQAEGVYGRCVACAGDIPLARLRSLPTVRYCVCCQEDWEQSPARRRAA